MAAEGVFASVVKEVEVEGQQYRYYSLQDLNDSRIGENILLIFLLIFVFFCIVYFFIIFVLLYFEYCLASHPLPQDELPYCIRILLECAVRNCDDYRFTRAHVETILNWAHTQGKEEIPFLPARVILQDFT